METLTVSSFIINMPWMRSGRKVILKQAPSNQILTPGEVAFYPLAISGIFHRELLG